MRKRTPGSSCATKTMSKAVPALRSCGVAARRWKSRAGLASKKAASSGGHGVEAIGVALYPLDHFS
jgi:hypothetical protein